MTENRARVLEVLTCSQIASRPSINKSLLKKKWDIITPGC